MILYHGSPIQGLTILNDCSSHIKNHEGQSLYLVDDKEIAKIFSANNYNSERGSVYREEFQESDYDDLD